MVNPGQQAQPINPLQVQLPAARNQQAAGNNQGQDNQPRVNIDQARQDAQVQVSNNNSLITC